MFVIWIDGNMIDVHIHVDGHQLANECCFMPMPTRLLVGESLPLAGWIARLGRDERDK